VTPDERAEAIRYCGFREPINDADRMFAIGLAVLSVSLVGFGLYGVVFASDAGERVRATVMLLAGMPLCWWGWNFYKRPVAPSDDTDLAREVRHRRERDADGGRA